MRAEWIGDTSKFFTNGLEYEFTSVDHLTVSTIDDEGDEHEWDRNRFPGNDWSVTSGDFRYSQKTDDVTFLRDLAERLMHVPPMYGTDQGDSDRLIRIAADL